jgi:hypothetical protein
VGGITLITLAVRERVVDRLLWHPLVVPVVLAAYSFHLPLRWNAARLERNAAALEAEHQTRYDALPAEEAD